MPTEAGQTDREHADQDGSPRRKARVFSPLVLALCGALILGVVAVGLFAVQLPSGWSVFASAVMFAAASLGIGGLVGLLFGVPRTLVADAPARVPADTQPRESGSSSVGANTNLEQISDWLTKIIVGVTLVQLGTVKSGATALFGAMAPALGGEPSGAAFAGAVVTYFAVLGFFCGWLYARLRLGVAMSNADALIYIARRAEREGDTGTAQAARQALTTSVQNLAAAPLAKGDDKPPASDTAPERLKSPTRPPPA
jgi:hypothetical protein